MVSAMDSESNGPESCASRNHRLCFRDDTLLGELTKCPGEGVG